MSEKKSIKGFFFELIRAIRSNKKEFNLASLGIFIFTLYIFIQRWITLSQTSNILQGIIVFIALTLLLHKQDSKKLITTSPTRIEIFWFIGLFVIIFNIILVGINKYISDIFMYASGFAFLFLGKVDIEKYKKSFTLIKSMAIIYALGSILQYFFTDSFNRFIFYFTDIHTQQSIIYLTSQNYFPGFGLGRASITAGFIILGMGLIIYFWDYTNKIKININILFLLILFSGLLMTGKRSVILWFIISLMVVYLITAQRRNLPRRLLLIVTALSFGFVIAALILHYSNSIQFLIRLDSLIRLLIYGTDVTGSLQERFLLYNDAWLLALEKPLFGIGWKQFVSMTTGLYSGIYHVHNLYIQLFCEMGIVGFTAVMLPLVYTFVSTCKALKVLQSQPEITNPLWRKSLILSLYYQTYFLLNNISDNPFYELNYLLMYFFMISIVNAYMVVGVNNPRIKVGN